MSEKKLHQVIVDIDVRSRNQPLDPKLFTFHAAGSTPVSSHRELYGDKKHPLLGQPAPPIALKTMEGKEFILADEKAEIVILDFWATSCVPCIAELPDLQMLHDWARKHRKSVAVYAVNVEETAQQARQLWEKKKLTMPVLMDTKAMVKKAYRVMGLPSTFVIHKGKIVDTEGDGDGGRLKLIVDHFLNAREGE